MAVTPSNVNGFSTFFHYWFSSKFDLQSRGYWRSHHTLNTLLPYLVKYVSPCSRTARKKCHAILNLWCKIHPLKLYLKIVVQRCEHYLIRSENRYLPSNPQNNWLHAAAAARKNASQQNPFAYHRLLVTVFDGVSWQVRIGLHQFDSCLSQVKIDVTTINNSCFFAISVYTRSQASSLYFTRTVPRHTDNVRQSAFLLVTSPNVDWF